MSGLKRMSTIDGRKTTQIISWIRNKLTRNIIYKDANRYPSSQTASDQPLPNLPDGPSARLSENYYYTRDGRCLVEPPKVLYSTTPGQQTLAAGGTAETASSDVESEAPKKRLGPTPPGFRLHSEMTPKTYNPKLV
ncbi:NADH dehydrogenase [ubiquinone] 1 alpha subcomplex subunit 7-like [Pecten maximus]|uniref:NADH dehydrogenase [ubiquinone] 1 alpha subcomplex subunit 7-like n=1 Tax=Pecten maximus TaxID=6579 RepID=UPI001458C7F6|nr:NADH dehydrogenase [ubiquinone] 1 alpha subcomplex subunit 7-like [Pecten maximus]